MKYKCIPAPEEITIDKGWDITERIKNKEKAVRSFAELINREATHGWKFHSMESIVITEKPGCFGALFGRTSETTSFNMLVFSNENLNISEINANLQNGKLIIKRISSSKGALKPVEVLIDQKQNIQLLNGEEKTIKLEGGKHDIIVKYNGGIIECDVMTNNNCETMEIFTIPEFKIEIG